MGRLQVSRHHKDWINAYLEYSSHSEAPTHMRFWSAVSAVAGALQRKVWIDQAYFRWYPNFYVILVAPPGVVSKTTTAGVAMSLLRKVPGARFGPDVVTWPSLVQSFAESAEMFEASTGPGGAKEWNTQCAMTLESGEFGNLLDPQDKQMVDLLVSLWDGKQGEFKKETKGSGKDKVENPWINLIACTTPSWIAGNFPEYMIGGGFTSRCIFVYAEKKAKRVAYPSRQVPANLGTQAFELVEDLIKISKLAGEYRMTEAAYAWGEEWYARFEGMISAKLHDDRFGGYIARKQTHVHKLAMVVAASRGEALWITDEHLAVADRMVSDLEDDMALVFSKIGRSDTSYHAERLLTYINKVGEIEYALAYQQVHRYFPQMRDFDQVISGLLKSEQLLLLQVGGKVYLAPSPKRKGPEGPLLAIVK